MFQLLITRVGNSLFSFLSETLVFCERKSKSVIRSFFWVNRSGCSEQKNDMSKLLTVALLFRANYLLMVTLYIRAKGAIRSLAKRRRNGQKHTKNVSFVEFVQANHSFLVANCSRLLFCQEQPRQIAHSRSLIWVILSKRAKNQLANSQPCLKLKLISSPSLDVFVTYCTVQLKLKFSTSLNVSVTCK